MSQLDFNELEVNRNVNLCFLIELYSNFRRF